MSSVDVEAAVPAEALAAWVAAAVPQAQGPLTVSHLSGGSSNLTFRVRDDANDWVLRRPPLSHVLATANDMGREYRVQAGLAGTDVPVPGMVAFCEDTSVLGAPFYLMEFVEGVVYADADRVDGLSPQQALAATDELVDVLAHLHGVDFAAVGLGELGRPEGFLERQVARWRKQWEKSKQRELPAVVELADRLERSLPEHQGAGIVHGDYSFNNTMWDRDDPTRMVSVLDWEMSTLGDPLTDLGMVVVYWGEVGELLWRNRAPQPHRLNPGFPDADHLVARYEATSGRSVESIDVYQVLAAFKLAVITEGAHARIAGTNPEAAPAVSETVEQLAALAMDMADASSIPTLRAR